MRKRKVAIASILKPVDDPRMFDKMGRTLADANEFDVVIIGYPSRILPSHPAIRIVCLTRFNRVGPGRLLMPWRVLLALLRERPNLLIVNTYELMAIGTLVKLFTGSRLVYDVRENYAENIRHTTTVISLLRTPVSNILRVWQRFFARFCEHIILAEDAYRTELDFVKRVPHSVVENRAVPPTSVKAFHTEPNMLMLLFTGTVAESTGIYKAVELVIRMAKSTTVKLHVVGRCARRHDLQKLQNLGSKHKFLQFDIDREPVPHSIIQDAIAEADVGLVCYPASAHTSNRIPTKLFEYMAQGLPFIIEAGLPARARASQYGGAAIVEDFEQLEGSEAARIARGLVGAYPPPPETLWQPEAFLRAVKSII